MIEISIVLLNLILSYHVYRLHKAGLMQHATAFAASVCLMIAAEILVWPNWVQITLTVACCALFIWSYSMMRNQRNDVDSKSQK